MGDLQAQLGHAALATTGIYLKANPNYRRAAYMRSGFVEFKKIDSMEEVGSFATIFLAIEKP